METLSRDDLASRLTLTVESASVGPLLLPDASITIMDVCFTCENFCTSISLLVCNLVHEIFGAAACSKKYIVRN